MHVRFLRTVLAIGAVAVFAVTIFMVPCVGLNSTARGQNNSNDLQRRRSAAKELEQLIDKVRSQLANLNGQSTQYASRMAELKEEANKAKELSHASEMEVQGRRKKLDGSKTEVNEVKEQVKLARLAEEAALEEAEKRQPSDSPYLLAKRNYVSAKTKHQEIIDGLRSAAEFQAAYKKAKEEKDRFRLSTLHATVREAPNVVQAHEELTKARDAYSLQRDKFMQEDSQCQAARTKCQEAHTRETAAKKRSKELSRGLGSAIREHKSNVSKFERLNKSGRGIQRQMARLEKLRASLSQKIEEYQRRYKQLTLVR